MNDYVRKRALAYRRKFNTSDPFKLADALGIEVMTCDIGSRLGCYMYLKRSKCIWISESLEGNERMFVMAHELAHSIMHRKENCYFIRNKTLLLTSKIEIEANTFAAELLISDDLIYDHPGVGKSQIAQIAGYDERIMDFKII